MELKDVLHFYIGCEVEYEGILNGKEMGEELKANKHDVFYVPKIEAVKGRKIGVLKSIDVDINGKYRRARVGRKGLQSHWGKPNFKLRLRKLSSMTEEDIKDWSDHVIINHNPYCVEIDSKDEYGELTEVYPDGSILSKSKDDGGIRPINGGLLFMILVKKGFDLFGLIESNQAIDINKQLNETDK